MVYEVVVKGGRVVDPAAGVDGLSDIAFSDGKVARIAPDIPAAEASRVVDASTCLVLPGLIDFHTHVYWGGTSLGVDAEEMAMRSGTTTFVDAGSAGAGNMAGFVRHVIEPAAPRILAYINVSFPGIFAFSREVMVGENSDLRLLSARECVRVAREFPDIVVGVKARIGFNAGGSSGIAPLDIALEIADELDLPVMAHIDFPPPSRDDILAKLRPGDILTHCFRPFPNAPVDGKRRVRDTIRAAHERGVLFDIGHGYGGFAFGPGRAAMDQGVMPDILSSDVHILSKDGPAYDILHIMNKFWALGMDFTEIVRAVTETPAASLRRPELGTLAEGTPGDATLVRVESGSFTYGDVMGETVTGSERLALVGTLIGGRIWDKGPQPS